MEKNKNYSLYLLLVAFLTCFTTQNSMASEYAITFSKSGIVSPLDSIVVINHTKGTKVKLAEGDVLGLNVIASINQIADNRELINIYPNPVTENSKLTFYAKKAGNTVIKVMALDGKTVTQTTNNLAEGNNTFFLALPKGAYAISIDGSGFSYSAKALSQTTNSIKPSIELSTAEQTQTKGMQKSKSASVNMEYQTGDKMQYKGYSGPYCNTVADVPTASKIVNFKYAECKDASGNYYYNFVTIGAQVWMVDNLRTTKFNNGVSFNNYTSDAVWNNLEAIRKTPGWCNLFNDATTDVKFGKLYNNSAANDARGINPSGWHIPTKDEWLTFEDYLIGKGYNFNPPSNYNSLNKSLAANTEWEINTSVATPGCDLTKNNATGFTALPSGYRAANGVFFGGRVGWWSSTGDGYTTYMWMVVGDWFNLYTTNYLNETGLAVRCIMN